MFRPRTQSIRSGFYSSSVVRLCLPTCHSTLAPVPLSPFVAILEAASSISPVFATLTKNTRGGVYSSFSTNSAHRSGPPDQLDPCRRPLATIPFKIRTYEKRARNSCRIRTSKTKDLKPCRMNTYRKIGRGSPRSRRGISRKTRPIEALSAAGSALFVQARVAGMTRPSR